MNFMYSQQIPKRNPWEKTQGKLFMKQIFAKKYNNKPEARTNLLGILCLLLEKRIFLFS